MDWLWCRITRAWQSAPMSRVLNDLGVTFLPALAAAMALYYWAPEDLNAMEGIVYPTAFFFITLVGVLFVRDIVPFLIRVVLGKPARERARTLAHFNTGPIEAQLRTENLPRLSTVAFTNDTDEEKEFAAELNAILERGGCFVSDIHLGGMVGVRKPKDVLLYLPDGGSAGLTQLHELIIRAGYKCSTEELGRIQACAILVGPPTH